LVGVFLRPNFNFEEGKMNKPLQAIGVVLGALAGIAGAGYYLLMRKPLAQTRGELRIQGLSGPVEILRDRWGIPHIYTQNENDLMFAQGFVHAQDRLWQMDFQRRLVAGRLSEVLGEVALPLDRWMRILYMRRAAEKELSLIPTEMSRLMDAYVAGVNAWIGLGRLPVEFTLLRYKPEPWTAADSLSWGKMMAWMSCHPVRTIRPSASSPPSAPLRLGVSPGRLPAKAWAATTGLSRAPGRRLANLCWPMTCTC
jgi:acyl-homoserine lactone acylase PvdQ